MATKLYKATYSETNSRNYIGTLAERAKNSQKWVYTMYVPYNKKFSREKFFKVSIDYALSSKINATISGMNNNAVSSLSLKLYSLTSNQ